MNDRSLHSGFTLIETLMVIVLMGIIGATLLMYFSGLGRSGDQGRTTQAVMLAEERLEDIISEKKANGFSTIALASPPVTDAGADTPPSPFTRQVEVFCVNEAALNTNNGDVTASCPGSDITAKRVRVILAWPGGSIDVATVVSDH